MMNRRVLLGSGLAVLAACSTTSGNAVKAPLPYEVREVNLDSSRLKVERIDLDGSFKRDPRQIESDVTMALQSALDASPSGDVDVNVDLTRLYLISRVEAAVPLLDSTVSGTIEVVDADTGAVVVDKFEFTAGAPEFKGAGVAGILLAPGVDKDYADTISGFALAVRNRLAKQ